MTRSQALSQHLMAQVSRRPYPSKTRPTHCDCNLNWRLSREWWQAQGFSLYRVTSSGPRFLPSERALPHVLCMADRSRCRLSPKCPAPGLRACHSLQQQHFGPLLLFLRYSTSLAQQSVRCSVLVQASAFSLQWCTLTPTINTRTSHISAPSKPHRHVFLRLPEHLGYG